MRLLRPLEWVLLAFIAWVLVRAGAGALAALTPAVTGRSVLILVVLVLVNAVLFARATYAEPWATPDDARRDLFKRTLPLALTPMVVVGVLILWFLPQQHERADSGPVFLAVTTFAIGVTFASPVFLLWLALWRDAKRHPRLHWGRFARTTGAELLDTVRDWVPLALIISGYGWMGAVMDLAPVKSADEALLSVDRWLFFGHDPVLALQAITVRPLSEWLSFAYSFFAPLYPITLGALSVVAGRQAFRQTTFALGLGLVLAYVSYVLVPAKGPLFVQQFAVPLGVQWSHGIREALMDETRITWDCFPSMHTAATLVMGAGLYRYARRLFFVLLPIIASIPFACVYLRYHYVIDVLVALPYAAVLVIVARRVEPDDAVAAAPVQEASHG